MTTPRRIPLILMLAATTVLLFAWSPSGGATHGEQVVAAGPGSFLASYVVPVAVVEPGGALSFANTDIAPHNVQSVETGPDDQEWCDGFPTGQCPLFRSEIIDIGTTPVRGLGNLEPGLTYAFYCAVHPNMGGDLVVIDA